EALQQLNISVTPNHIRALRNGRRRNPSFRLLAGLAEVFRVPLDYFVDDSVADEIQDSLQALVAMRDAGVQQFMMRAHGVSTESMGPVLALLDQIRRMEGLDKDDDEETGNSWLIVTPESGRSPHAHDHAPAPVKQESPLTCACEAAHGAPDRPSGVDPGPSPAQE